MELKMTEERMTVREQAAWWLTELQAASGAVEARFAAWLKESPRHVEEFLFFNAMWRELDGVDPERRLDLDALIAEAKTIHSSEKIVALGEIATHNDAWSTLTSRTAPQWKSEFHSTHLSRRRLAAVFALVVIAVPLTWLGISQFPGDARTYSTAIGEQRAVKLADGSFAHLNTHTRIEVDYSEHGRDVRLVEGEALFTVRRDASRPFRVRAGEAIVQAVGTEFNVNRRVQGTTVSVIEGVVRVFENSGSIRREAANSLTSPDRRVSTADNTAVLQIIAGEQADVAASGKVVKRSH